MTSAVRQEGCVKPETRAFTTVVYGRIFLRPEKLKILASFYHSC
jgi:hypothetical protein